MPPKTPDGARIFDAVDAFTRGGRNENGGARDGDGGGTIPPVDHEKRITTPEAVIPTLAIKADLSQVEGKLMAAIERGISETQRWMLATVIGLFLGFGGLFLAMSNTLKPTPQPSAPAQQPTVIVLPAVPAASR